MQLTIPDTPPSTDDTIARDHLNDLMNMLTRKYYWYILVICPNCDAIKMRSNDAICKCSSCALSFRASDVPDLFF